MTLAADRPIPTLERAYRSKRFRSWWQSVQGREGCWEWGGSFTAAGYGQVQVASETWKVHRLVYALCVGPLDVTLTIDHLCRNRACGNPAHLEQVSSRVNTLRGRTPARRNAERTHCPRGHAFTPDNIYWRDGDRRRVRRCRACAIAEASLRNKRNQPALSARHMDRYHTDPVYRARKRAIQRAYHARKREATNG